jgi:NADPH-dependent glutamate synthase beta subunit-like oxidoreductase/ferredoxin
VNAARYIRLIREDKPDEAVAVVREKIPFPSVCAYICAHPCESSCTRGQLDEPIAIRMLKRYAVDNDTGLWKRRSQIAAPSGKRLALIGSGPAGLSAGYYLSKLGGHSVTVFEALPKPGGMMLVGIPAYRLPRHILAADIKEIEQAGVTIKTNTQIDTTEILLEQGYNAVLLAVGAHEAIGIGVPGDDAPGILGGVEFLRQVNLGRKVDLGNRVAVIGGGNTAMDSARTAVRLGASKVTIVYRRTRAEMPASPEEIEDALAEGIKIVFLAAPSKVVSEEGQLLLECLRMKLGPEDSSGRRRPEPIEGSQYTIPLDNIIAAISQRPVVPASFAQDTDKSNRIQVNKETMTTGKKAIFAAGDAVLGPATVIEAIASGRQAAISIDKYLGGSGNIDETLAAAEEMVERASGPGEGWRPGVAAIPLEGRLVSFDGVELGWGRESAIVETERCLRCDLTYNVERYRLEGGLCIYCGLCVESCPFDALYMSYEYEHGWYRFGQRLLEQEQLLAPDKVKPSGYGHPEIEETLPQQTLLIDRY